ncbi:MAG TPA: hydrolase 2, exosortase A system-associated, partial [Herbaspirillum sp.]|nr:hydrolase 2, exosortase A system-associated [Herbaspirillum sp.]
MSARSGGLSATPFFLQAVPGERFCIYHAPHPEIACRGAFVYVHPFADEMNRSRRMAALQARAFAEYGYGVLSIDLFGCGDSSGETGDASWEAWKSDLELAVRWLEDRLPVPVGLWGLRLGALLALDFIHDNPDRISSLIVWNPIVSGKSFMTQFLRLRLGSHIVGDGKTSSSKATIALREALMSRQTLEIAGYDISPALGAAIDALDAATLPPCMIPVHWFEIVRAANSALPATQAGVAKEWRRKGVQLHLHTIPGLPFWATPFLSASPELI